MRALWVIGLLVNTGAAMLNIHVESYSLLPLNLLGILICWDAYKEHTP